MMEDILLDYFRKISKKTVSLLELQNLFSGEMSYSDFAGLILELDERGLIVPIKKHGMNGKSISLFNSYKVNKQYFQNQRADEIQRLSITLNPHISLEAYYKLGEDVLHEDKKYLQQISHYLNHEGWPEDFASSPERSYSLVGDEKWIDYKGGKKFLERIKVWDALKISYSNEPLMLAVHPDGYRRDRKIKCLVVENKATFFDCLEGLADSDFGVLVFGSGWKIAGNIQLLPKQLGVKEAQLDIYYFGDLDHEGIAIWHHISEKSQLRLARPFYKSMLEKAVAFGKGNQQKNKPALKAFLACFEENDQNKIRTILGAGKYCPQESLSQKELLDLWGTIDGN